MTTIHADQGTRTPSLFFRQLAADAGYCVGGFAVALLRFVLLVTLFAVGVGTAIIGIGIPILVLALYVARRFADIERQWIRTVRGRPLARPAYKSRDGRTGIKRLVTPMSEAQSWLDFVYGIFALIPAVITFALTVAWWAAGIGGTFYFLWAWNLPLDSHGLASLLGFGGSYAVGVALQTVLGLLFLVTAPLATRVLSIAGTSLSRAMLTSDWIHGTSR